MEWDPFAIRIIGLYGSFLQTTGFVNLTLTTHCGALELDLAILRDSLTNGLVRSWTTNYCRKLKTGGNEEKEPDKGF